MKTILNQMKNAVLITAFMLSGNIIYAQMPKWCVTPSLIDFSGSSPTASALPGATTINYAKGSNAAFDPNGNVLFHVNNGSIIQNNGTVVFTPSGSAPASKEEGIVKVPGYCNRYYVIRIDNGIGDVHLHYNMVEVASNGTVSIVAGHNNIDLGIVGNEFAGMAISKLRPGHKRFLFAIGRNYPTSGIKRFIIDGKGIYFDANVINLSELSTINKPSEVEIYENSFGYITLAWNYNYAENFVNLVSLTPQGNLMSYTTKSISSIPGADHITGLEFFDNGSKLIFAYAGSGTQGLAVMNIVNGVISQIPSSADYKDGMIEKAPDNNYYTIGSNTKSFARIDPVALTVTHLFTLSQINNYSGASLPEQVDDELFTSEENWRADLVMRDDDYDMGIEANTISTNIWESPDLWNCRTNQGNCFQHENPGFLNPNTLDNYMRVKITNKGCMPSGSAVVKMYWTLGSTQEIWPTSWTGVRKLCSLAAGGIITAPGGISIPSLNPGQSAYITQAWDPVDPGLFSCTNLETWNDGKPMICMLARIESASDPMFKELQYGKVSENVKNNNNIVTRNTSLVSMSGSILGPGGATRVNILAHNPNEFAQTSSIGIVGETIYGADFTGIGITVTLNDVLWAAWEEGGMEGSGITLLDEEKHIIEITNINEASLDNITLPAEAFEPFTITMQVNEEMESSGQFRLSVSQRWIDEDDLSVQEGSECHIIASINEENDWANKYEETPQSLTINANAKAYKGMTIVPNPANDKIRISIPESMKGATISIVNALGQLILKEKASGSDNVIDVHNLPKGIYIIKASSKGEAIVSRFVKD